MAPTTTRMSGSSFNGSLKSYRKGTKMLLTPEILRKINKKEGWGMCTQFYTRFKKAYPEGVEVNKRNLTKMKVEFESELQ